MIGTSELWIILLIVALLFGASSIPKIAKALGQAKKEFKNGLQESEKDLLKNNSEKNSLKNNSE